MKSFLFFLFVFLALFPDSGQATEVTANDLFRPCSAVIAHNLIKAHIEKVGDLNLIELVQSFRTVRWLFNREGYASQAGSLRSFGFYTTDGQVIVNVDALERVPDGYVSLMCLHEALGALKYDDRNYQLSMGLFYVQNQSGKLGPRVASLFTNIKRLPIASSPKALNRIPASFGGSGTSVGGGGDWAAIVAKNWLILTIQHERKLLNAQAKNLASFSEDELIYRALNLDVEVAPFQDGAPSWRAKLDKTKKLALILPVIWDKIDDALNSDRLKTILELAPALLWEP